MGNSWNNYLKQCKIRDEHIIKMALQGMTIRDIAPKFGLTHGRIDQVLRQHGLKVPIIKGTEKYKNMVKKMSDTVSKKWEKKRSQENKNKS